MIKVPSLVSIGKINNSSEKLNSEKKNKDAELSAAKFLIVILEKNKVVTRIIRPYNKLSF